MIKQKLIYKEPWQVMAERWEKYYTEPGRPTKGDLAAYRKFIKQAIKGKNQPRVLVLGATPELRDLLYELKCEVTIIDAAAAMVQAMTGLKKHRSAPEKVVISDWIDNPLKADYFDVIVGDIILANIPRQKQPEFLRGLARMLKPGGYFISRFFVAPDKFEPLPLDKFLAECKKFLPKHRNSAMEMIFAAYKTIFDTKKRLFDLAAFKNGLKKYWRCDKFVYPDQKINYFINFAWETWQPMEKAWAIDFEKDVAKLVSRYFVIKAKGYFSDVFWKEAGKAMPLWFCRVKK